MKGKALLLCLTVLVLLGDSTHARCYEKRAYWIPLYCLDENFCQNKCVKKFGKLVKGGHLRQRMDQGAPHPLSSGRALLLHLTARDMTCFHSIEIVVKLYVIHFFRDLDIVESPATLHS
ncbi:hypothetical protein CFC21_050751 [Triticum aestivum]|uniref:Secreted protein n=2 Tax=Triticum aestivum TaxID=4565 RepID=A0A3B6H3F2_WHEAT|nr:hypothetical protein CFC21_050751 [Triticum aestivum]